MTNIPSTLFAACVLCAGALAQSFECYAVGPLPAHPLLGCEGVSSNDAGDGSGVTSSASCGFPTSGARYALLFANGPITAPNGGPLPRPVDPLAQEIRIPIPAGATAVSFDWEFFNVEGPGSGFNDGTSIDIVDSGGFLVQALVYADAQSPVAFCGMLPAGPNPLAVALGAYPACSYLSVVVWNEGDDVADSNVAIDNIRFMTHPFSSPFGSGSLQLSYAPAVCPDAPSGYFIAVTFNQGTFPNGWLFGLDIATGQLASELAQGGAFFAGPAGFNLGPFAGLPPVTIYAVILAFNAQGTLAGHTSAFSHIIP